MDSYRYVLPFAFDFPAFAVVLDVGCGMGNQLSEASASASRVIGVEPDVSSAKHAHNRGFPVI